VKAFLSTRDLPDARVAGRVGEQNDIADKERFVRPTEVQQHALMPGDGMKVFRDDRRSLVLCRHEVHARLADPRSTEGWISSRLISPTSGP